MHSSKKQKCLWFEKKILCRSEGYGGGDFRAFHTQTTMEIKPAAEGDRFVVPGRFPAFSTSLKVPNGPDWYPNYYRTKLNPLKETWTQRRIWQRASNSKRFWRLFNLPVCFQYFLTEHGDLSLYPMQINVVTYKILRFVWNVSNMIKV